MATYYTSSNNQRDSVPMLCLREPLPNPYHETPILPSNMTLYMNSSSYSEAMSANSQLQNNCFVIPPIGASHSPPEQREIIVNIGGLQTGEHDFSAWREGRNEMLVRQPMDGQSLQGQGLSLSLGTEMPPRIQMPPFHDRNHNSSFDSFMGTNTSISGNGAFRSGSSREEYMRHSEYFPPGLPEGNQDLYREDFSLHGMSSVGKTVPSSKYLKAAQQLLDEVVNIQKATKRTDRESRSTIGDSKKSSKVDDGQLENERPPANGVPNSQCSASNSSRELSHAEKQDLQNQLTKLLSMLDEVDSRYKQYYHQMQIVVSSFDAIAGCGAAKPYTVLALQTISRHFRCLHDAITGQISAAQKTLGEQDTSGNNKEVGISRLRYVDQQIRQQRALQQLGMMQNSWRPQRGLPESSVSILRAWLFEHFLHPYPKDSDKIMLARQTGLTRSQVSNWFINARVRLWKPMIEEMYKQELCDADMGSSSSSDNASKLSKSDVKTSNDAGDDSPHCQSSVVNKNYGGEQAKDLRSDQVLDTETVASTRLANLQSQGHDSETEHRLVKQTDEQRPSFGDCGLIPNDTVVQSGGANDWFMATAPICEMSEFGRFKSGNAVSLTLGLQHCEGGSFLPGQTHLSLVSMREDDIYNAAATSTIGAGTAELECIGNGNQQQRFNSPHSFHDFVV